MNTSGGLLLVAGLVVLWLLAKGYGKNVAPAWQTLTGTGGAAPGAPAWPAGGAPPIGGTGGGGSVSSGAGGLLN